MKWLNGLACVVMGFVLALLLDGIGKPDPEPQLWPPYATYHDPLQPEAAPVAVLVPAQEAKAEPAPGVSETEEVGPSDSGVEPPSPVVPPESTSSLREAIEEYRRTNGTRWFVVQGLPERDHLVVEHGWTHEQIAGLTDDELHLLHGMSHTGRVNPKDFLCGKAPAVSVMPASAGVHHITIISPATWDCPVCPGHRNQDWSAAGFDMTPVNMDGLPRYPCTEWTDSRGVIRRLYGKRTPAQVRWSYDRTMQ